jgi:ornithine carbamoyltransferase
VQKRDLLSITDLSIKEIQWILNRASELKQGSKSDVLSSMSVALLFEKPSLRTKLSFDTAIHQLGGHPIYFGPEEIELGKREPVADIARVMELQVDCIVARTYQHSTLEELAKYASIPIINALSDMEHPSQALADLLTIKEYFGRFDGITVAFVGDGNNVANSLALGAISLGINFIIASPNEYELSEEIISKIKMMTLEHRGDLRQVRRPEEAVYNADVVYTDVWTSMGQESEFEKRKQVFRGYQVNNTLMALAKPTAIFMHDLPAHRGEEIDTHMLDHPQSVVFQQAENKLHAAKGILELLLSSSQN